MVEGVLWPESGGSTPNTVNIHKLKFQLNTMQTAEQNGMHQMLWEQYDNTAGIDTSLSTGYVHDSTLKLVKVASGQNQAVVVSKATTASYVPTRCLLSVEATGTITYAVSRDGGTTFTDLIPDRLADIYCFRELPVQSKLPEY